MGADRARLGGLRARRGFGPFGADWQVEPETFAQWIEHGGVFGPMRPPAADSGGSTEGAVDAESVSATLGWLYLKQGHLADADEIFARVLRRSGGDARALEGQTEVARRRLVERKIVRLRRFLAQMRDAER